MVIGIIGIVLLFTLIALGIPIAFALFLIGFGGVFWLNNFSIANSIMTLTPLGGVMGADLATLPLFILVGSFAIASGVVPDGYQVARAWFGRLHGGLGVATIAASAFFGACSGSSVAGAAIIGKMAIPEMRKYGYSASLATGTCGAGGLLATLIPPSGAMVVYGIAANESIGRLLIAGTLPGILLAVMFAAGIYTYARINPAAAPRSTTSSTWKERLAGIPRLWGVVLIFLTIFLGIFTGLFTATEAAAFGTFIALLTLLVRQRGKSWRAGLAACRESATLTAAIFFLILGAYVFGAFIILAGLPKTIAAFFLSINIARVTVILIMIAVYYILGMFIDTVTMVLITIPIFYPVVIGLGYSGIWFGVIVVMMMEIGMLSPPFAINIFVIGNIAPDIPLTQIYKGSLMFILLELVVVGLLTAFPEIALWLPSLMR